MTQKNQSAKAFSLVLTLLTGFGITAHAGVSTSGGGFAVVCRAATGSIQSAELLDLYEARVSLGFKLMPSTGDIEKDAYLAGKHAFRLQGLPQGMPPGFTEAESERIFAHNAANFLAIATFTKPGEKLPQLTDLGKTISVPLGCYIEQLAIFHDQNQSVSIQTEIWNALDSLNKAALVEHEIHYHALRAQFKQTTSEMTRLWVSHAFADNTVKPVTADLPASGLLYCTTKTLQQAQNRFFLYQNKNDNKFVLQFLQLGDYPLIAKSTVDINGSAENTLNGIALLNSTYNLDWFVEIQSKGGPRSYTLSLYQKGEAVNTSEIVCSER